MYNNMVHGGDMTGNSDDLLDKLNDSFERDCKACGGKQDAAGEHADDVRERAAIAYGRTLAHTALESYAAGDYAYAQCALMQAIVARSYAVLNNKV